MENIYPPGIEAYVCVVCCQKENMKINNSCLDFFSFTMCLQKHMAKIVSASVQLGRGKECLSVCSL